MTKTNPVRKYDSFGHLLLEQWSDENGKLHREGGPAETVYLEHSRMDENTPPILYTRKWLNHGKLHRADDPASVQYSSVGKPQHEQWYQNGILYRQDGKPTSSLYGYSIGALEREQWVDEEGQLHRDGAPAIVGYNTDGTINFEEYYLHGEPHNPVGAALIGYSHIDGQVNDENWWINGVWYDNFEEWLPWSDLDMGDLVMIKMVYGGTA